MADGEEDEIAMELPEVWKDDQRMNVMFSPFRDNREINPNSWDTKHKFWTNMITQCFRESNTLIIDPKTLPLKFKRSGKTPVCLQQVLRDMQRNQKIMSVENYRKIHSMGWMSWGFSTFVKKPVSWTLGAVVGSSQEGALEGTFIHPELVKEKAEQVLRKLQGHVKHVATDFVLYYNDVKTIASSICGDEESLNLVVLILVKQKKVTMAETKKGEKVLKFLQPGQRSVGPVSEVELGILRLQSTHTHLSAEVDKLSEDIQRSLQDAKYYVAKGLRNSAKNALRRKKGQEKKLDQKECSLQVLTNLLEKIQDAESEKMILDAYEAGAAAMKQNTKDGLDLDKVEHTLDAVQEVLDNQAEITQALSTSITDPALDISESDLMSELEHILEDEANIDDISSSLGGISIGSLPAVPDTSLQSMVDTSPGHSSQGTALDSTFTMEPTCDAGVGDIHRPCAKLLPDS